MNREERQQLKQRLQKAAVQTAKEFKQHYHRGDRIAADLAHDRWIILFRAARDIDSFRFEVL